MILSSAKDHHCSYFLATLLNRVKSNVATIADRGVVEERGKARNAPAAQRNNQRPCPPIMRGGKMRAVTLPVSNWVSIRYGPCAINVFVTSS